MRARLRPPTPGPVEPPPSVLSTPLLRIGPVAIHAVALDAGRTVEAACAAHLSADERDRAGRYATAALRRRFVVRRGALRSLLGRRLRMAPAAVPLVIDAWGRPALAADGAAIAFNLSHSGELALIALAPGAGQLGIDVERVRPLEDLAGLALTAFSPDEQAAFRGLDPAARLPGFYVGWTRKEAYLKAQGIGLGAPLGAFSVSLDLCDPVPLRTPLAGDAQRWELATFTPAPGYLATLAWSLAGGPCP